MASKVYEFNMEMTCEGCSNAAKKVLGKQGDAVSNIETDLASQKVVVTSTMSPQELLAVLEKTGKKVSFIGEKQ